MAGFGRYGPGYGGDDRKPGKDGGNKPGYGDGRKPGYGDGRKPDSDKGRWRFWFGK